MYQDEDDGDDETMGYDYQQACLWPQISIAVEFLVLSCRTKGFALTSQPASIPLLCSVFGANIIVSLLVCVENGLTTPKRVHVEDILRIWLYNIIWFIVTDVLKLGALWALGELDSTSLDDIDMPAEEQVIQVDGWVFEAAGLWVNVRIRAVILTQYGFQVGINVDGKARTSIVEQVNLHTIPRKHTYSIRTHSIVHCL